MEIASKYDPSEVESKWYDYWLKHELFKSVPDNREPYTVVIPPPNVTGVVAHGTHAQQYNSGYIGTSGSYAGKECLLGSGNDHASIATEAKVVAKLASEGIKKTI